MLLWVINHDPQNPGRRENTITYRPIFHQLVNADDINRTCDFQGSLRRRVPKNRNWAVPGLSGIAAAAMWAEGIWYGKMGGETWFIHMTHFLCVLCQNETLHSDGSGFLTDKSWSVGGGAIKKTGYSRPPYRMKEMKRERRLLRFAFSHCCTGAILLLLEGIFEKTFQKSCLMTPDGNESVTIFWRKTPWKSA